MSVLPTVSYDKLVQKWAPVLNEESAGPISDSYRKKVTAAILENQEEAIIRESQQNTFGMISEAETTTSSVANFNPVLISLVRRAMPNLIAYDVAGVQPMTGPTGLVFAMKSRYKTTRAGATSGDEALFNEAITGFSGDSSATQNTDPAGLDAANFDSDSSADDARDVTGAFGGGMSTADGETLGTTGNTAFAKMGFTIERQSVTAKTRALAAGYTIEMAQDLKAIHGLEAETELANILAAEVLSEINREVIRTINSQAKSGGALTSSGVASADFDMNSDADGRWMVEKFKGLLFQIERDANKIFKETRRGRGNFIICSADIASAMAAAGVLDYAPAMNNNITLDENGNTFAGVTNSRMRVYIDNYATTDYVTVGYKGSNAYDAGIYYAPYVPLTMVRATGEEDFQPRIAFKTRYGMVSNPFVGDTPTSDGLAPAKSNQYFRIFRVNNLAG